MPTIKMSIKQLDAIETILNEFESGLRGEEDHNPEDEQLLSDAREALESF